MVTPFDALTDAIVNFSGYHTPGSPVYLARNPGGLKAYSPAVARDEHGNRVFKTDVDGWQALRFDVRHKISGKAKLKPKTLEELAAAYSTRSGTARAWAGFIRAALSTEEVTPKTPLTFFYEEK